MSSVPTNAELEEKLRQNMAAPAEASNETGSVKQHSLKDQIEASKYLGRAAITNPFKCIRVQRTAPVGASGTSSKECA